MIDLGGLIIKTENEIKRSLKPAHQEKNNSQTKNYLGPISKYENDLRKIKGNFLINHILSFVENDMNQIKQMNNCSESKIE